MNRSDEDRRIPVQETTGAIKEDSREWEDVPHDQDHEELWNRDGAENALLRLLEQEREDNRKQQELLEKQLFYTRIFTAAGLVIAMAVLIFSLAVLPRLTAALDQVSATLEQVSVTLEMACDSMEDLGEVTDHVNDLVDSSGQAVEKTMEKIDRMDIEKLNQAIDDLSKVVQPLAEFFGKFSR